MKLEHIKSYYIINGLCLFIVCVILTVDLPLVRYICMDVNVCERRVIVDTPAHGLNTRGHLLSQQINTLPWKHHKEPRKRKIENPKAQKMEQWSSLGKLMNWPTHIDHDIFVRIIFMRALHYSYKEYLTGF